MRMPEKIEADMFAPCGMNCMVCYIRPTAGGVMRSKAGCSGLWYD